jgi:hypothetical protein
MKAVLSKAPGLPDTLVIEDVPSPMPKAGEVLIAIKAVGVNFPDFLIIQDMYQFKPPRPFSPGGEISGVVKAVGEGVTTLAVGDKVFGSVGSGGMAEEIATPAIRMTKMPDGMPFEEAAAFLMTYGTSHHALKDRAKIQPGEKLLVLGAAAASVLPPSNSVALWAPTSSPPLRRRRRSISQSRKARTRVSSIPKTRSHANSRRPSPTRSRRSAEAALMSSMTALAATMPSPPCAH